MRASARRNTAERCARHHLSALALRERGAEAADRKMTERRRSDRSLRIDRRHAGRRDRASVSSLARSSRRRIVAATLHASCTLRLAATGAISRRHLHLYLGRAPRSRPAWSAHASLERLRDVHAQRGIEHLLTRARRLEEQERRTRFAAQRVLARAGARAAEWHGRDRGGQASAR